MADLPESLFLNPFWHALRTAQSRFALCAGEACRYPADVIPFAALESPSPTALRQLHTLLAPGESVWIMGESRPHLPELAFSEKLDYLQMVLPTDVPRPHSAVELIPLSAADAPEMVALTTLAFPGYFRLKTCDMGQYYGVRHRGELIAMGGERLKLDGYSEISGVCTHPEHRGKGYAVAIMWQVAEDHRRDNLVSFLHVGSANHHAAQIYRRMGFLTVRNATLHRAART